MLVLQRMKKSLGITLLVLAMLVSTLAMVAAAPPEQGEERSGVFGEVIVMDGDVLLVRTKSRDLEIHVTADTKVRTSEDAQRSLDAIKRSDRIAALVVAQIVMVIPQQGAVVHIIGVVVEVTEETAYIITEDGRRIPVEFGLNQGIPAPGTVVTIVSQLDPNSKVVQAHSIQCWVSAVLDISGSERLG